MALLAVQIPEDDRIVGIAIIRKADFLRPIDQLLVDRRSGRSRHRHPGEIALHVRHEDRHAGGGEALRQPLQCHRLAGAGGAGDQAVAVALVEQQPLRPAAARAEKNRARFFHARCPLCVARWISAPVASNPPR
jgi:hypothetical protein